MKLNKVKGVREKVAEKGRQTKSNIQVSGVPEEEKQKNETKLKFHKVIQENFSRIKEGLNYISKEATGYLGNCPATVNLKVYYNKTIRL